MTAIAALRHSGQAEHDPESSHVIFTASALDSGFGCAAPE